MIQRFAATERVFQSAINFSEGRDVSVLDAIATALSSVPGAVLIDRSSDVDHHRSVMTLLGDAEPLYQAILAGVAVATARIDLRQHSGVHPRIGATDVIPIVPLQNATEQDAVQIAERIAQGLAAVLGLPILLYEWNAKSGRTNALPLLRKGGFEALRQQPLDSDYGPKQAHPSAGVSVVGARPPLVAYNVNLACEKPHAALAIARTIRSEREKLALLRGVRALGLTLPSRRQTQVSLNLTQPQSLPNLFRYIQSQANQLGVAEMSSEIIGAIPQAALANETPEAIHWNDYRPTQILEYWFQK